MLFDLPPAFTDIKAKLIILSAFGRIIPPENLKGKNIEVELKSGEKLHTKIIRPEQIDGPDLRIRSIGLLVEATKYLGEEFILIILEPNDKFLLFQKNRQVPVEKIVLLKGD